MKVYHHPDCLLHNPPHEFLGGKTIPYLEEPSRVTIIQKELAKEPGHFQLTDKLDDTLDLKEWIVRVHELEYLEYLGNAYVDWVADGGNEIAVFPETFPHISLISKRPIDPKRLSAIPRAGLYCFDLSSPITKDTFQSILASLRVTLSAAKEVSSLGPKEAAFALCRPPGHHAMPSLCGGYCFLNNVAIAARFLQNIQPTQSKVAILDIDYHHGNGTQAAFYNDPSVLYVSLHAENDYPYFTGTASEVGEGDGKSFNVNIPLPRETTGDDEYCTSLSRGVNLIKDFDPAFLLVSLGVDTHESDPISDFRVTTEGYLRIGRTIAEVGTPTLFVLEGGYHLESIGLNVRNVLNGFQA